MSAKFSHPLICFSNAQSIAEPYSRFGEMIVRAGFDVLDSQWGSFGNHIQEVASPEVVPPEVVLDTSSDLTLFHQVSDAHPHMPIGLLHVGGPDYCNPLQVSLPSDVSEREFATTVRLLTEVVRLQRQRRQASEREKTLRSLAMTDALTGLPNRRAWQSELMRKQMVEQKLCLALIDFDFFKRVNDIDGLAMGDRVLHEAGQAMRVRIRDDDFIARLGGDEFGLLVANVDVDVAELIVERVRTCVTDHFRHIDLPHVTLSAGYVFTDSNQRSTPESLYGRASSSLKEAKSANRDCTVGQIA